MSVLLDSGIVYAYYDRSDRWHARARTLLEGEQRGLILPAPVIPEVDHLVALAETLRLSRVATTDRRHFDPLAAALSFEIVP